MSDASLLDPPPRAGARAAPSTDDVQAGVGRVVLGTLHFALLDQAGVDAVLDEFAEAGGRWIDTAPFYGSGRVEAAVGDWVRRCGAIFRVSTKVGHFADPAAYRDPRAVEDSVARSVERLNTVPAAVSLHEGDWAAWWRDGAAPGALLEAADAPALRAAWEALGQAAARLGARPGITGNNAGPLRAVAASCTESCECGQVMVAKQYDLLWRTAEPLVAWCAERGVRVWCAAPFHQGALFRLAELADEARAAGDAELAAAADQARAALEAHGEAVEGAAVPFLLHDGRVDAVVIGVRTPRELRTALQAAGRSLPEALLDALRRTGVARPPRPGVAWRSEYR